jgi:dienelactone hydrolase
MSAAATIRERASAARDDWVFVIAARRYRHLAESEDLVPMQHRASTWFRRVLAASCVIASGSVAGAAHAQGAATSECYFDMMRMVDAQPLGAGREETDEATGNLHYLLSLPKGHDKTKKWPVVVFMHGIGEVNAQGSMLNALTKHSLPRVVEDPMFNYPFIVISPQINNDGWVNHAAEIGAALDRIETEFGGDKNREYLTGLSYGGAGTLAVGIALAERIAALMPVTPGGSVANWDNRSKIVNKPIWFFLGVKDNEYNANMTRSTELEASGAETFFKYTYAFADEYKDAVPKDALTKKHIFGSYENIGHDVWHAAYGVYCPTLDAQKTVQYDWLLQQSLDGTPFVDPRNPNGGTGGGGAATGGSAGSAGTAGGATAGMDTGGSGGAPATTAGTASVGTAGTASMAGAASGFAPSGSDANDSSGCGMAPGSSKKKSASAVGLLLLGFAGAVTRRRRARRARGGALRGPAR